MKNKIKIFHIIETLGRGGAENLLKYSLKNIDKNKFSVKVICLSKPLNLKEELEGIGVPVFCLKLGNMHNFCYIIFKLYWLLIKEKPDAIHTHLFFANIYGRIAGRIAGIKAVITTLHNPDYSYEDNGKWSYKFRKLIDKYSGRICNDYFVAVSSFVKKDFEKQLGFKNIKVLYNCIDGPVFKQVSLDIANRKKNELGFNEDNVIILNVGRLHPQKGQACLIEAFNLVYKNNNRLRLIIVGKGCLEDELKDKVRKLNLEKEIAFLRDRKDISEILLFSDIFVFPSFYEGFGIALIEAMASGLPVIASNIDVLKELIDNNINGILIEKGDHRKLAETISGLIDNIELRHYLGRNAREKAIKLSDPIRYTKKLEDIYKALVYA